MHRWGMALLNRQCSIFWAPSPQAAAPRQCTHLLCRTRSIRPASFKHAKNYRPAWSAYCRSSLPISKPGRALHIPVAGPGPRNLSLAARKKALEAAIADDTINAEPAPADDPRPAKKRGRRKKAEAAAAESLTAESLQHRSNSQPQIDLQSNVPQGAHWDSLKTWVVFSDLHVSPKTAEVACQVLQRVREEAHTRNAGVLFLGKPLHSHCFAGLPHVISFFKQMYSTHHGHISGHVTSLCMRDSQALVYCAIGYQSCRVSGTHMFGC